MGANAANSGVLPSGGFDAQAAARAGMGGGLSLFHPDHKSGEVTPMPGRSFDDLKAGFAAQRAAKKAESDEIVKQRQLAQAIREKKENAVQSDVDSSKWDAGTGFYTGERPAEEAPREPTTWTPRKYNFAGIDKGWEEYESDWQKSINENPYEMFSPEWMQRAQMKQFLDMEKGLNLGYGDRKILHSIQGDARDKFGYGSDYGQYYDSAYGKGALEREANRYAEAYARNDPAIRVYDQYGGDQIDWTDAGQVEAFFRNANTGGTNMANLQSMIAQNKRTDLTEGLIMMAASAGMGALAAPAGASFLASATTPDALIRAGIGAAGSYG